MTFSRFLAASAVLASFTAYAEPVSVPNTFVNGQVADAVQVNANFTALVNGINNIVVGTTQIAPFAVGEGQLQSGLTLKGDTQASGYITATGDITAVAIDLTSDRNAKEAFLPVNAREVLEKVAALPISEWQYKTQSDVRHIGPMAQDFRAAFAVGIDEKHITSVDADGVALAAIQGLNEILEERDAEIAILRSDNEALSARLRAIERHLGVSEGDKLASN